jgi:DNA-binding GntR family transcriptional regulator
MFQVLEALESLAGKFACDRISNEQLLRIKQLHRKMKAAFKRRNRRTFFAVNQPIRGDHACCGKVAQ